MLKERNFRYPPRQNFPSYEQTSSSTESEPVTDWQSSYLLVEPRLKTAIPVPEQIALTVPTPPAPTASPGKNAIRAIIAIIPKAKFSESQLIQAGDRLDRTIDKPLLRAPSPGVEADLHTPTLLGKDDRSELERSVQKRTHIYNVSPDANRMSGLSNPINVGANGETPTVSGLRSVQFQVYSRRRPSLIKPMHGGARAHLAVKCKSRNSISVNSVPV
jgi:hypothetical protein